MENEIGKAEKSWVPKWDGEIADYNKKSIEMKTRSVI
jgi:hypothetical protein